MASGNHICNGNIADLPAPPIKIPAIAQLNTEKPMNVAPAAPANTFGSPEVNNPKSNVFV